jgi:hypothetical protein
MGYAGSDLEYRLEKALKSITVTTHQQPLPEESGRRQPETV